MNITDGGIISQFLDLLGVQVTTATGDYVAFLVSASLAAVCVITFTILLFKFLVYLRRR